MEEERRLSEWEEAAKKEEVTVGGGTKQEESGERGGREDDQGLFLRFPDVNLSFFSRISLAQNDYLRAQVGEARRSRLPGW